ncbi:MAG: T9SS type A sorting domain-containing protein [Bacteroidaceae bacterium]|nr:T9SS type A sorting domain-containing protein [Bacteroidaceae bacterium]
MKKRLYLILLCSMLVGMPVAAVAAPSDIQERETVDATQADIKITVSGNTLRVTGAAGLTLDIYSVTGQKVKSVRISANDETVNTGLPRGCYIVKVGETVRKVSLG